MSFSRFKRFQGDIPYDLLIPPLGLDFRSMTPKQAEENFNWFMSIIPERINYFQNRCSNDLGISMDALNFSAESLLPVWRWFLKTAKMEKTPQEELDKMKEGAKIFGESFINWEQFTVTTKLIMRDIGIYVGQCFILNYSNLSWSYKTKPKTSVTVNQPIIAGFRAAYMGNVGDVFFAPFHMTEVQAANLYDNTQTEADLYNIFMKWVALIPKNS